MPIQPPLSVYRRLRLTGLRERPEEGEADSFARRAKGPLATLMNVPAPGARARFGRVRSTEGTLGRLSVEKLDELVRVDAVDWRSERVGGDAVRVGRGSWSGDVPRESGEGDGGDS